MRPDPGIGLPARTAAPADLTAATNFFTVGGHSLLAVTMLGDAHRRTGIAIRPSDFLADPTVAGLARLLRGQPDRRSARAARQDRFPVTSVQQRMWLLDRLPDLRMAYLVPVVVRLTGAVDVDALRDSLDEVLARHPALRSRFALDRATRTVRYRTDGPPARAVVVHADA